MAINLLGMSITKCPSYILRYFAKPGITTSPQTSEKMILMGVSIPQPLLVSPFTFSPHDMFVLTGNMKQ